jgi:O-antigen/teichoic acid export membrane protein
MVRAMNDGSSRGGHGLLRNSMTIAATSNLTAGLGYLFWTACSRNITASDIGMTATVISAMLLVALLAAGGFIPLLIRTLSTADLEEFSGLSSTAFIVTAGLAGAGGALASVFLPISVHAIIGTPWLIGIMSAGSAGSALLLLVNAVLVGVRRADFSLVGNVAASLLRLVAVAVLLSLGVLSAGLASTNIETILLVWLASFAISFGLSVWLVIRAVPGFRFRPGCGWLPRLGQGVGWEHLATLGAQLPVFILPILAARRIPAAQVGYLYMALMAATAFFAVAAAVSTALLADCAKRPEQLQVQLRRSLRLTGAILVIPGVVTCLFARELLSLFGADYGRYASTLLIILVLSSLPDAVTSVAVSALRLQKRLAQAALLNMAMGAVYLLGAWFTLPHLGIAGAGWSHLAAQSLGMAVVLFAAGYFRVKVATATSATTTSGAGPTKRCSVKALGKSPYPGQLLVKSAAGTTLHPYSVDGQGRLPGDDLDPQKRNTHDF